MLRVFALCQIFKIFISIVRLDSVFVVNGHSLRFRTEKSFGDYHMHLPPLFLAILLKIEPQISIADFLGTEDHPPSIA